MDVLIVLVFVSLVLVAGSIVLLVFSLRQRDFEHADRLSLLPLLEPGGAPPSARAGAPRGAAGPEPDSVRSEPQSSSRS